MIKIIITFLESLKVDSWISIISCIIAVASAIFAYRQAHFAKKAYNLQKQIYADGKAKLNVEVLNSFIFNDKMNSSVFFYFGLNIANLSDKSTSIKDIVLMLMCNDLNFKPPLSTEVIDEYKGLTFLNTGENVNAHNTINGWCLFKMNRDNYERLDVDKYVVMIEDIHGYTAKTEAIFIGEKLRNHEI